MGEKTYHELILKCFIIISVFSILTTGISLSMFFTAKLEKNIEEYNSAILKNAQAEILNMKDFVIQAGFLLAHDGITRKYLNEHQSIDYFEWKQLLDRITNTAITKDYIDSIYLIYPKRNSVLTSKGLFTWDAFIDNTCLDQADGHSLISWVGRHEILTDRISDTKTNVSSAIFNLSKYFPRKDGYLVINISENDIYTLLEKGDYKNSYFMLLNDKGNIITASAELVGQKESIVSQTKELIGGKNEVTIKIEEGDFLTTIAKDQRDGWEYYILTPMSEANGSITQSWIFISATLLGAIIASYLLSTYLRKNIYTPVQSLIKSSNAKFTIKERGEKQYIEFNEIRHRFDTLLLEKYSIEEQIHYLLPTMKERFFVKLLSGQLINNEEIETQLSLLGLDLVHHNGYIVFYIQIDNTAKGDERSLQSQNEETWISSLAVKRKIDSLQGDEGIKTLYCMDCGFNKVASILAIEKETSIRDSLLKFIHPLTDSDPENLSITIGIGNKVANLNSLQISASQASEALELSYIYGKNQVLFYNDVAFHTNVNYINPLSYEKALTSAIKTMNTNSIVEILNQTDHLLYTNQYSLRMIRQFYLGIVNFISIFTQNIDNNYDYSFNSYAKKILEAENLQSIRNIIEKKCIKIANDYDEANKKKARLLSDNINKYIKENFMLDLSLNSVAEEFHISGTYINRILKKHTRLTFYDILTNYRLSKAKEILESTDLQIYQIAEQTGYTNVQSFIRMFKKEVGVTPGSYRQAKRNF